jgi:hypothetical protein
MDAVGVGAEEHKVADGWRFGRGARDDRVAGSSGSDIGSRAIKSVGGPDMAAMIFARPLNHYAARIRAKN